MVIKLLYNVLVYQANHVIFEHIMTLYSSSSASGGSSSSSDSSSTMIEAMNLYNIIQQHGSKAFIETLEHYNDIVTIINRLLLIIQYNTQVLPIISLPSTSLLTLLPTFSRLNHSCSPNATLYYQYCNESSNSSSGSSSSGGGSNIIVHLSPLIPIARGEEITISYLSNPMMTVYERNDYLKKAFDFHCQCHRCIKELSSLSSSLSSSSSSSSSLSNTINEDNVSNLLVLLTNIEKDNSNNNNDDNNDSRSSINIYNTYNDCMILLDKLITTTTTTTTTTSTTSGIKMKCTIKTIASISILMKLASSSSFFQRINLLYKSIIIAQSLISNYHNYHDDDDDTTTMKEVISISYGHANELLLLLPLFGQNDKILQKKVIDIVILLNKYMYEHCY